MIKDYTICNECETSEVAVHYATCKSCCKLTTDDIYKLIYKMNYVIGEEIYSNFKNKVYGFTCHKRLDLEELLEYKEILRNHLVELKRGYTKTTVTCLTNMIEMIKDKIGRSHVELNCITYNGTTTKVLDCCIEDLPMRCLGLTENEKGCLLSALTKINECTCQ